MPNERNLLGRDVRSSDGGRLGHVADVYVDAASRTPTWLVLRTGRFGSGIAFVPAEGAAEHDDGSVVVPFTRRRVQRAPRPLADGDLSPEEEATLARHYVGESATDVTVESPIPPGAADATMEWLGDPVTESDEALVRYEEELDVVTPVRPAKRARLVKTVVTEEVTITVPVRREVVHVEYEDVAEGVDPASDAEPFSAVEPHELVLYEEVVDYSTRIVAKERVRLRKEVVPEIVDLRADVRKEQVDVDGGDATAPFPVATGAHRPA